MHASVCGVYVCDVCICGSQGLTLGVFSRSSSLCLLRQDLSLNLALTDWLGWLSGGSGDGPVSVPVDGDTDVPLFTAFCKCGLRIQIQAFILQCEALSHFLTPTYPVGNSASSCSQKSQNTLCTYFDLGVAL